MFTPYFRPSAQILLPVCRFELMFVVVREATLSRPDSLDTFKVSGLSVRLLAVCLS